MSQYKLVSKKRGYMDYSYNTRKKTKKEKEKQSDTEKEEIENIEESANI